MTYEFIVICLYLFFGCCFGFVTFPYRHLFSEGPEKPENSDQGLNTAWVISKRKKQAQKNSDA
jgi:hypothetical protein